MGDLKLGKLAATRPHGLSDLSVYSLGKLPPPPRSVDPPSGLDLRMDLNDQLGDCTIAGVDHLIATFNGVFGENDPRPNDDQIRETYFALTGGQDSGLAEADVLQRWYATGLFGQRIAGYAPVDARSILHMQQAIDCYGAVYLGIQCPASAQEQFAAGQPWTYVPDAPVEGGHCIVGGGYTPEGILTETWGGWALVTYSFLAHFEDEAWCVLSRQARERGQDRYGIDFASLDADLARLSGHA